MAYRGSQREMISFSVQGTGVLVIGTLFDQMHDGKEFVKNPKTEMEYRETFTIGDHVEFYPETMVIRKISGKTIELEKYSFNGNLHSQTYKKRYTHEKFALEAVTWKAIGGRREYIDGTICEDGTPRVGLHD